jgi:hypothetical protein
LCWSRPMPVARAVLSSATDDESPARRVLAARIDAIELAVAAVAAVREPWIRLRDEVGQRLDSDRAGRHDRAAPDWNARIAVKFGADIGGPKSGLESAKESIASFMVGGSA